MNVEWVKSASKSKVKWLGAPPVGVGSLDTASNTQAKALLASWNVTDGNQCVQNYGLNAVDTDPNTWANRDGWVLACFVKWWNSSGKFPQLTEAGTKDGVAWADITQEYLSALQQWGLGKGVINQGQIPSSGGAPQPVDLSTCTAQCNSTYGVLDPVTLATCLAACAQKFPPVPVQPSPPELPPPPGTSPPIQPPPNQPPPPQVTPTTTAETKSSPWPWVIGAAAVLGIGALVLTGAR